MQPEVPWSEKFSSHRHLILRLGTDRAASCGLAALVAYAAVRSLIAAATTPFSYDELCTYIVARQPTVSGIWNALTRAADGQAPGFYLIERAFGATFQNQEVAFRLPSILAFCFTIVCLFVYVRRRYGSRHALLCAAILLVTSLFHSYATDARPYSLVVACVSVALVCYQRSPGLGWMLLMGSAFAISVTLSYFAVFPLALFGIAEFVLVLTMRRFRWRVWAALALGIAPLAVVWRLLAKLKEYYGALPYAKANLSAIIHVYGSFFDTTPPWGVAIVAILLLGMLGVIARTRLNGDARNGVPNTPLQNDVLVFAFLGLPLLNYFAAKITNSAMSDRYVLPAVLGLPLALAYLLPRLGRRGLLVAVTFVVSLVVVQEAMFWKSRRGHLTGFESPAVPVERLVTSAAYPSLPVVVSDGLEYLAIAHYATPSMARRFVCLVDVPASIVFSGDDVLDKELAVLRTLAPIQVWNFADFASRYRAFLVYSSNGSHGDPHDWWVARLVRDGYLVRVVAADHRQSVFLVTFPEQTP